MKSFAAIMLAIGLASAAPAQLATRQVATPPAGSKESFEQAASIIGSLAKGLQAPGAASAIPFGPQSGSILGSIAQGLADAGKSAKPAAALSRRQLPGTTAPPPPIPVNLSPPPGSKESFEQAASIIGSLAKGLQGATGVPFGPESGSFLGSLAAGLAEAGKSAPRAPKTIIQQLI